MEMADSQPPSLQGSKTFIIMWQSTQMDNRGVLDDDDDEKEEEEEEDVGGGGFGAKEMEKG
eukprot:CAMPEP_0185251576 /NCGR_PEP_ID=MMETSP1359-20130426/938_1 /TAXON_ID=552665 /ORGANISM="Bigelowiella longifila, Strain CCMP242" /LENGTH=60 /DNA_ID=CAMNT_0027833525 /DNA_START=135 /DNA_END=316 /DNA_ORIENTATION=-